MTALKACLGTPELLENVLLRLDMRTLITSAQRVSHQWQDLITSSPALQQHLFFQPAPASAPITLNTLLAEKFPHWFPSLGLPRLQKSTSPLEEEEDDGLDWLNIKPTFGLFNPEDLEDYDLTCDGGNEAYRYMRATWRTMLPRQPPIRRLTRCRFISTFGGEQTEVHSLREGDDSYTRPKGTKEPNDEMEIDEAVSDTIKMSTLYNLVTIGRGDRHGWVFIWAGQGDSSLIPVKVGFDKLKPHHKDKVENALESDGLVLFERMVIQCTGRGPWPFAKKYDMRTVD